MAKVNEKAPKEFICPGCGAAMANTAFRSITETCGAKLVDGWICPECADKLRIKYPVYFEEGENYYYEKKGDKYVQTAVEDGGRPIATAVKNFIFNSSSDDEFLGSTPHYTNHLKYDPLRKLTCEQVKDELANLDSYRAELVDRFGGAENGFEVLSVMDVPKLKPFRAGLPNIKRFKGAIVVEGLARLGAFHKGDLVEIHHGGQTMSATVLMVKDTLLDPKLYFYPVYVVTTGKYPKECDIDSSELESDKEGLVEGTHGLMILGPQAAGIAAGDIITFDS